MQTYIADVILCFALAFVLVSGAIIIGSVVTGLGIGIMRLVDRRTGKKRFFIVRRVL